MLRQFCDGSKFCENMQWQMKSVLQYQFWLIKRYEKLFTFLSIIGHAWKSAVILWMYILFHMIIDSDRNIFIPPFYFIMCVNTFFMVCMLFMYYFLNVKYLCYQNVTVKLNRRRNQHIHHFTIGRKSIQWGKTDTCTNTHVIPNLYDFIIFRFNQKYSKTIILWNIIFYN